MYNLSDILQEMGDWLKDNPVLHMLINTLLSVFVLLFMFHYTGTKKDESKLKKDVENLKIEKAPYTYVDKMNEKIKKNLESKADKSLVESMDSKLDLILIRLSK